MNVTTLTARIKENPVLAGGKEEKAVKADMSVVGKQETEDNIVDAKQRTIPQETYYL